MEDGKEGTEKQTAETGSPTSKISDLKTDIIGAARNVAHNTDVIMPVIAGCGCGSACPVCVTTAATAIMGPTIARIAKTVYKGLQRKSMPVCKPVKTKA